MGESNDSWGEEVAKDPTQAALWDRMEFLTDEHPGVAAWAATKDLCIADLTRIGTRWSPENRSLVWMFPDGFKYRRLPEERWMEPGFVAQHHKLSHPIGQEPEGVIVAEGESDGAWLRREFPTYTIAMMPTGAGKVTDQMIDEISDYPRVLIATDNDKAGNHGAKLYMDKIPKAERMLNVQWNDWCEYGINSHGSDPDAPSPLLKDPEDFIVVPYDPLTSVGVFITTDLGTLADNQWFEDAICQVKGMTLIHGKKKSLKSMIALEFVRALSTGTSFAGYVPFIRSTGPARVAIIQYEVPPFSFKERILGLLLDMPDDERLLFQQNVFVHSMNENKMPRLKATDKLFLPTIQKLIEPVTHGPNQRGPIDVVLFDPIQRMTGGANQSQSHEMDGLLGVAARLQDDGLTTIWCHHNNKQSGDAERDPDSMTGTQRFSGDADSIASVWYDKSTMVDDHNPQRVKERNFDWEVRSGGIPHGRGVRSRPVEDNPSLMHIEYVPQHGGGEGAPDDPEF